MARFLVPATGPPPQASVAAPRWPKTHWPAVVSAPLVTPPGVGPGQRCGRVAQCESGGNGHQHRNGFRAGCSSPRPPGAASAAANSLPRPTAPAARTDRRREKCSPGRVGRRPVCSRKAGARAARHPADSHPQDAGQAAKAPANRRHRRSSPLGTPRRRFFSPPLARPRTPRWFRPCNRPFPAGRPRSRRCWPPHPAGRRATPALTALPRIPATAGGSAPAGSHPPRVPRRRVGCWRPRHPPRDPPRSGGSSSGPAPAAQEPAPAAPRHQPVPHLPGPSPATPSPDRHQGAVGGGWEAINRRTVERAPRRQLIRPVSSSTG